MKVSSLSLQEIIRYGENGSVEGLSMSHEVAERLRTLAECCQTMSEMDIQLKVLQNRICDAMVALDDAKDALGGK